MAKEEDRHIGRREAVWFPLNEHAAMLAAMAALKEKNKSNFIRSAVRYLAETIQNHNTNKGE